MNRNVEDKKAQLQQQQRWNGGFDWMCEEMYKYIVQNWRRWRQMTNGDDRFVVWIDSNPLFFLLSDSNIPNYNTIHVYQTIHCCFLVDKRWSNDSSQKK